MQVTMTMEEYEELKNQDKVRNTYESKIEYLKNKYKIELIKLQMENDKLRSELDEYRRLG